MIQTINKETHYAVVGGANKYYINANGDVYSMRTHDYLKRTGNIVRLNIDGVYKKHNCNTLLIEALLACVKKLSDDNKKLCDMLMHYYK